MNQQEISAINAIVERLDKQKRCDCKSATHDEGCIVPMLLDLHRRAKETRHQIIILKCDRDMTVAKRLAEEEMQVIYGPYTDHTIQLTGHELTERYAAKGYVGYIIRIETNLTDEELSDIKYKQYEYERKALGNIGQVTIDGVDIGIASKVFP